MKIRYKSRERKRPESSKEANPSHQTIDQYAFIFLSTCMLFICTVNIYFDVRVIWES